MLVNEAQQIAELVALFLMVGPMEIDLNDPNSFTMKNVAKLIRSKDDSKPRQLRVSSEGIAYLCDEIGPENKGGVAFRLETWDEKTGNVGPDAADNTEWVGRIYECLKKNWPNPKLSVIDVY